MTTTICGSNGHSVLLDLGTTRNMQISGQLASMISSGSTGTGGTLSLGLGGPISPDTVSPSSGMTSFAAASVSGGSLLFLGETVASATAAASTAAASGNTTLDGGLGKDFSLLTGVGSLSGALGAQAGLLGGTTINSDMLMGLTKTVSAAAHVDTASTVQATAGTTITLSDATRITFQSVVLHSGSH